MRILTRTLAASIAVVGASSMTVGAAQAATSGTELTAHDNGDCTVTFTLTNHTNSTFYQPDWWFEQEGPAPAPTADPATYVSPWRVVPSTGTTWAFARWVGDPPLHSEVADGVPVWKPGVSDPKYLSDAQPDGKVSTATVDIRSAKDAPAASDAGTQTIWFRIGNGTSAKDRVPAASIPVTGCGSDPWGSSLGSFEGGFGSLYG